MTADRRSPHLYAGLAEQAAPGHTALLVIDMQRDFCADDGFVGRVLNKDVRAAQAIVEPIMDLVGAARSATIPVIWVKAAYDPENLSPPMRARQRDLAGDAVCCPTDGLGGAFYGVTPAADEPVIEKHCYSAFSDTELDGLLRRLNIETLVLTGVQTNVCIDSTLRQGHSLGYYVVVPGDCVSSHAPDLHDATLANVRALLGTVTTGRDLTRLWGGAAGSLNPQRKG